MVTSANHPLLQQTTPDLSPVPEGLQTMHDIYKGKSVGYSGEQGVGKFQPAKSADGWIHAIIFAPIHKKPAQISTLFVYPVYVSGTDDPG